LKYLALILIIASINGCITTDRISSMRPPFMEMGEEQKQEILQKADKLNNSGIEAYREKRYEDAISYYKQSLNIKRRFLKENSLSVAKI